jgi:hypothetical protein
MQILSTVALMEQSNPTNRPAKSRLVSGTWRLLWSQQAENASPLQKWGSSQSKNYQVGLPLIPMYLGRQREQTWTT